MYPSSLRRGQSPRCSHPACGSTANLSEVITDEGIERPFTHYQGRLRGELRGVLRVAQLALADACDRPSRVGTFLVTATGTKRPQCAGVSVGSAPERLTDG